MKKKNYNVQIASLNIYIINVLSLTKRSKKYARNFKYDQKVHKQLVLDANF